MAGFICEGADFPFNEPIQPPRSSQIIVHRGEANQAPENSQAAITRCIEDGLEWAEVDVRLTRDGHHVLSHDDRMSAGVLGDRTVAESTLAELKEIDLGSDFAPRYAGVGMLSLGECFELAQGRLNLYLDCKSVNPEQLAREIINAGMERQVVVFGGAQLRQRVHASAPGRIALMAKWHPAFEIRTWAESNHLAAVEIDADALTPSVCRAFHDAGLKVEAKVLGEWDRPEFWRRSLEAGADWLQTDHPEELLAHIVWRHVPTRPVRFSLHRGAGRYAPENTLPALEKAVRLGADYVEFDVRTTSDDKYYLLHDSTLDRTTDGTGSIARMPSQWVESLDAGAKFGRAFVAVGLPTLDEGLAFLRGRVGFYVDAKAITPEALAEALDRHGVVEQAVVYQSAEYLLRLKAINPRIRVLPPLGVPEGLEGLARRLQPYAVDIPWDLLSQDLIARCHALDIRVFSDALGAHERVEDYRQAMDWGIDLIQTDHPLRLLRAIELHAGRARQPNR